MFDKAEAKGAKKLSRLKMVIIITLLAVACAALLGLNVYQFLTKDTARTSANAIREQIVPVAKMTTFEYNYTEILAIDDAGNPLNIKNPLTSKLYIATVEGTASVGVNVEKLECTPTVNNEGVLQSVTVTLPHSEVLSNHVEPETLHPYADQGTFNKTSKDDLNALYVQAQETQLEKVKNSDMLTDSDDRISQLITQQIQSIHGDKVRVDITFV